MLVARPYLGRGAHAGAAGSGCHLAEPGSPRSAAAPAPAPGRRRRWALLPRATAAEPPSPTPTARRARALPVQWGGCAKPPPTPPVQHCTAGLAGGGQAAFELLPEPVVGADGLLKALAQAADLHQVFLQQICPCHHSRGGGSRPPLMPSPAGPPHNQSRVPQPFWCRVSPLFPPPTQAGRPRALQQGPYPLASGCRSAPMAGPRKAAGRQRRRCGGRGCHRPRGSQPGSAAHGVGRAMPGLCCPPQRGPVGLWAWLVPQAASHLQARGKAVMRRRSGEGEWG